MSNTSVIECFMVILLKGLVVVTPLDLHNDFILLFSEITHRTLRRIFP